MADLPLEQRVENLHSECCELRRKLIEKEFTLEARNASLKSMICSLEKKLSTIEEDLLKSQREISEYVEERKYLIEEIESLRNTITYYEEMKPKSINESYVFGDESIKIESPRNRSSCAPESMAVVLDMNSRNEEIGARKSENELQIRAIEEYKNKVISLEDASKLNDEKMIILLKEKEKMELEVSNLKRDFKTVRAEVDSIQESLSKQENEIKTLRNREENIFTELTRSKSEVEYLSVRLHSSESKSMNDSLTFSCDEPMKVDTPIIGNPVLSFRSKRIQFGTPDENESPTTFSLSFKRPQPMQRSVVQSKRNRSLFPKNMNVMNSNPEIELSIMKAVQKADQDANLIGDFTKPYALPLIVNSKHQDLKTISPETLASVIKGDFNDLLYKYIIVDCRYPYEYEGGHIIGAKNIYCQDQILAEFFDEKTRSDHKVIENSGKRSVIIFHCEFSSERGPSLYRYLRSKDREMNTYPNLYHPEVYLLNGGYKAFFENFKELCVPQQYLPMLSKDHKHHLRQFKYKSKSWNCENKFAASALNISRQ